MHLARSLAGHDKGKLYYVVYEEDNFLYLSDGRLRPLENPKKKKLKHAELIKRLPEHVREIEVRDDSDIRKVLKAYNPTEEENCQKQM